MDEHTDARRKTKTVSEFLRNPKMKYNEQLVLIYVCIVYTKT